MKTWTLGETYSSVRPFRIEVMRRLGFTDRQAEFLAHVLVFSGVFMERQYCRFAGLTHGRKSVEFLHALVDRGYAKVVAPGKAHSGRFYHLHYKPLYEAIRLPNSRNRRRVTLGRFIERLMLLDIVLGDQKHCWMGTETDKVAYFRKLDEHGRTLRDDDLPRVVFGMGDRRTTRYFPDKLPIGISPEYGHRLVFVYLLRQPSPAEFRVFLARHAELLSSVFEWTIRIVFPRRFWNAKNLHVWAFRDDLTKQLRHSVVEEFRNYLEAKHKPDAVTPDARARALTEGAKRFESARFQALERVWLEGGPTDFPQLYMSTIQEKLRLKRGQIEVMVLPHKYLHLSSLAGVA